MKNRFFVDGDLIAGATVALSEEERHHARVLRVRDGEQVEVFNGRASFVALYDPAGNLRIQAPTANREPRTAIHLAMSIIELDKFELVLQKATELGAASFVPLIAERCVVRPERYAKKSERWQKIVFEAVKQSGRATIPAIESPLGFDDAVARPGSKVLFDGDTPPTEQKLESAVTLFIGPEGGWSEREIDLARTNGCAFRRLGSRRLRAETAAIVATAIIAAQFGDI